MESTQPKSFVFVLMPFDSKFNDVYKFGIKGAADDVGAYAERVDEQIYSGGILERIFNQISKADVIIADMTGRNPNVFYEVGYAHALGKIVLLLTQNAEDIPFDLKHRPHTVYGGQIETLRTALLPKLQWALAESRRQRQPGGMEQFSIRVNGIQILPGDASAPFSQEKLPVIEGRVASRHVNVPIHLRNDAPEGVVSITHVYLFCARDARFVPYEYKTVNFNPTVFGGTGYLTGSLGMSSYREPAELDPFTASPVDAPDGLSDQFRISASFPAVPPGAVEEANMGLIFRGEHTSSDAVYRLPLHSPRQFHDFRFRIAIEYDAKQEAKVTPGGKSAEPEANGD